MRFGFHISIAGGFSKVVDRAKKKRCETIQLFSRNPRGWKYTPLNREDIKKFRRDIETSDIYPVVIHMPYLPNLASPDPALFKRSIDSLVEDLKRSEYLGATYLITHVGSRLSSSEEEAIIKMAKGINQGLKRVKNKVILLLENTAGQGTEIGYSFSHIGRIIRLIEDKRRIGIVLDTAHAFEAGYDLRTEGAVNKTLKEFDKFIGLKRLKLLHLNDSKTDIGSRVDRHWHIGEGKIGEEGFKNIVKHPLLEDLPGIMETPRKSDKEDLKNMAKIRSLAV